MLIAVVLRTPIFHIAENFLRPDLRIPLFAFLYITISFF